MKASRRFSGQVSMWSDSQLCYETNFFFFLYEDQNTMLCHLLTTKIRVTFLGWTVQECTMMHMNSVKLEQGKMLKTHRIFSLCSFCLCSPHSDLTCIFLAAIPTLKKCQKPFPRTHFTFLCNCDCYVVTKQAQMKQ